MRALLRETGGRSAHRVPDHPVKFRITVFAEAEPTALGLLLRKGRIALCVPFADAVYPRRPSTRNWSYLTATGRASFLLKGGKMVAGNGDAGAHTRWLIRTYGRRAVATTSP